MRGHAWNAINTMMLVAFLFSVAVQYNDPDPIRWMSIYGAAALACILEMRRHAYWRIPAAVAALAIVWAMIIAPRVAGRVHVADLFASFEMHDATVEQAREMGGLLIVGAWMLVLFFVEFRRARETPTRREKFE